MVARKTWAFGVWFGWFGLVWFGFILLLGAVGHRELLILWHWHWHWRWQLRLHFAFCILHFQFSFAAAVCNLHSHLPEIVPSFASGGWGGGHLHLAGWLAVRQNLLGCVRMNWVGRRLGRWDACTYVCVY